MILSNNNYNKIQGLFYVKNFLSAEKEKLLVDNLDTRIWSTELKRRVQHYGYKYDYRTQKITLQHKTQEIPSWLALFDDSDQVIVNEYQMGQGIAKHIDSVNSFGGTIRSISLLSPCIMIFQKKNEKIPIVLEPRSFLQLSGEARYIWSHAIPPRKTNITSRRISITFRQIKNV